MALERRGMARRDWASRFLRYAYVFEPVQRAGFAGHAGLIQIHEVSAPFIRGVTLADAGFAWLQLAPADANWWLTVMYDACGTLVQYYFDITWRNFVAESGEPMFEDLFLDIVMKPDGKLALLDRDELDEALEVGAIDNRQYLLALDAAQRLLQALQGREGDLRAFCAEEKSRLERRVKEEIFGGGETGQ